MSLDTIGFRVCLHPNKTQEKLLWKYSNHSRGLYNILLAEAQRVYKEDNISVSLKYLYEYYKQLKNSSDYLWLLEFPESAGKQICKDLIENYKRVFKSNFGFPKFKKKGLVTPSFYQRTDNFYFKGNNKVVLTGIGTVRVTRGSYLPKKEFQSLKLCNPRIKFDGKYWYLNYSIQSRDKEGFSDKLDAETEGIGIDVGLKDFMVVSNGMVFENFNKTDKELLRLNKKLKDLQRLKAWKLECRKKFKQKEVSNNINKISKKIKLLYRRIGNIKSNYMHLYIATLVKTKPEFVAVETLDIKGMKEADNNLSKEIQKVSWYEIFRRLKYKSNYYEIPYIEVGNYYPSTKLCSGCGNTKEMTLEERVYNCPVCGLSIDRDFNSSLNIREEGYRLLAV